MMVQPVIQKDDILEIKISSRSSSTNLLFSQNFSGSSVGDGQAQSGGQNLMPEGFQVDIIFFAPVHSVGSQPIHEIGSPTGIV